MINQERLVSTFLELIQIDSPSGGEREIAERVAQKLRTMGLEVQVDALYNVTAMLDGQGKPLFLGTHRSRRAR